jgi:CBS domain-containing protein
MTKTQRVRRIMERSGAVIEQSTGAAEPAPSSVATIMSSNPWCVRADVPIGAIADLMLEHGFSAVPVVDGDGRPHGIVSKTDLLGHLRAARVHDATAADIMMPVVFTIDHRAPLGDAAALMGGEGVHRLPVIDSAGAVVGILSTLDLVRWLGQLAGYAF